MVLEAGAGEGLSRRLRLRQRRDFLRVQRSGTKIHTRFFLVFVAPRSKAPEGTDDLPQTRLGVTVTRKVGKAVRRNRIKRLVREAFRRERHALPAGFDMVWVAKRDADEVALDDVLGDMRAMPGRMRSGRSPRPRQGPAKNSPALRSGAPEGAAKDKNSPHPTRSRSR